MQSWQQMDHFLFRKSLLFPSCFQASSLSPKCFKNTVKNRQTLTKRMNLYKNADLEQTQVFTVFAHILAPQTHQLFINILIDFYTVFHTGVEHSF